MQVVDPDDPTREVAQGERGELLIKGPQVFSGYWNNPEETAKTLLPDGWLRTGDVVTVDADGFTTIVDRVKELIITGGFNVAPSEVEAVLRSHPDVTDAAVVGVPGAERRRAGGRGRRAAPGRDPRRGRRCATTAGSASPATRCRARSSPSTTCPARCSARCCASRSATST